MSKKASAGAVKADAPTGVDSAPSGVAAGTKLDTVPSTEILATWESVHDALRQEFGEAVFRSWLKPMQLQAFYQGTLEVSVPTRFMRDWIGSHYHDRILTLCRESNPDILRVQIVVQVQALKDAGGRGGDPIEVSTAARLGESDLYSELSSALDPRFTFETFVVGKPNAFAHAACRRVVEADGMPFNPLYIYGGVGLGKTHLMHAMAHSLREKQSRKVVYLSAEKFMYQFVRALRRQDSMNFKEQFRSVDVLMIDDIQFIAGKDTTQEEFFHTFNALVDQGKLIVISGDRAPMDLEGLDERLRSRLGWGLVADIKPSTFDLRLDVVKAKAGLMGVDLPADVSHFLAGKITSNIRELEGALNRLAVHRDMTGLPLTLDVTQDVLSDVLRSYERRITIDEIQRKVAEHYNLRLTDMHSARRSRNVARPRQVAMYLCKKLTTRSLPEIGRKFGGRDHTTVMHAVKKVEELMGEDNLFADEVNSVRRVLKGD
ncbi:MAG: chromosomal replication initiator protein DnaA [Rhodospirillales bacterium]|nr:chromosomal replication initiator protein DnaA [Alphaproteobacteria bacterium]MCB9986553.1 chromosomal replication initiator protein DnaA [Rhodospirillales bacterium]USO06913.1 MAG: chromosomal replication initiator protein DnaA [Rhodospirillales bacterium]